MADRDQSLAAEPAFHGQSPSGGCSVVISVHHVSDRLQKVLVEQSENLQTFVAVPAQPLRWVMEHSASGSPFEAASRTVIKFVHGGFDEDRPMGWDGRRLAPALVQGAFEIADAFFHGTVIARVMGRIV